MIGRASAVAQIGPLHMSGLLAWLTWLFVHLMYLVEFSNRVLVFVQWGFLYLTFNRGARLITGPDHRPFTARTCCDDHQRKLTDRRRTSIRLAARV